MGTAKKVALTVRAAELLSSFAISSVYAADDVPEASPLTVNGTVTNDYRYRGISQSNLQPAIQGGIDYVHNSGFYLGNWNSSVNWTANSATIVAGGKNVSTTVEVDFYAGYKYAWSTGFTADIGVVQYYYPTDNPTSNPTGFLQTTNTTEIYAAQNFTFDAFTGFLKFSYAVTPLFGEPNSAGSNYTDLTINYDTRWWGLSLNAHVGYQYVAGNLAEVRASNNGVYSYTDWKLGVTKDFGNDLSATLSYVATNAKNYAYVNSNSANLGRAGLMISVSKSF